MKNYFLKTISAILLLCFSTHLLISQSFAVHPECSEDLAEIKLKECTEEKILEYLHNAIKPHLLNGRFVDTKIVFDINKAGVVEPIRIKMLKGEAIQAEIESALKSLSKKYVFKPAEEDGYKIYDTKRFVIKFTAEGFNEIQEQKEVIKVEPAKKENTKKPKKKVQVEGDELPRLLVLDCEGISGTAADKKGCADLSFVKFIYDNIRYPAIAYENGVEGTVQVQFRVNSDGTLSNAKTVRDIGARCGSEALRVVKLLNEQHKWIPATKGKEDVEYVYTIPVRYDIESFDEDRYFKGNLEEYAARFLARNKVEKKKFKVVEEMPRFPNLLCEYNSLTNKEKKACADKEMLRFIYKNLEYPAKSKKAKIDGTALVQFTVGPDGVLKDIKVKRTPSIDIGLEAKRIVELMNVEGLKWIPGLSKGTPVDVQFNLPIKFRL